MAGRFENRGGGKLVRREVADTRKELYIVQILDTSGSMNDVIRVNSEVEGERSVRKITQLNEAINASLRSMKRFEETNVDYKIYVQFIELNSFGRAYFNRFEHVESLTEAVELSAEGCTCLDQSLNTLLKYINTDYLGQHCNHPISVILMSDGEPTNRNGYALKEQGYRSIIDNCKETLRNRGYLNNIEFYAVDVGCNEAGRSMLRYFVKGDKSANENHYFAVSECDSIVDVLDKVTRLSLTSRTRKTVNASGYSTYGTARYSTQDSAVAPIGGRTIYMSDSTPIDAPQSGGDEDNQRKAEDIMKRLLALESELRDVMGPSTATSNSGNTDDTEEDCGTIDNLNRLLRELSKTKLK